MTPFAISRFARVARVAAAAMLLATAGCTSTVGIDPAHPALDLRGRRDPRRSVDATSLYPAGPLVAEYLILAGEGQGDRLAVTREATGRFQAQWADHEGDLRTDFWRVEQDGSIVLCAVIDRGDSAISLFDPPLLLLPATLTPGEPLRSESSMRVVDLKDPRKLKEKGAATRTLEYIDDQVIRTPTGEFRAMRVAVHFEASLRLAKATRASTMYLVPELGLVAEESEEDVNVLGLAGRTVERRMVLIDQP